MKEEKYQRSPTVCLFNFHTNLYILHLSLDESAYHLKLRCNHGDRSNRKIHLYYGSVSSGHRLVLTHIHQHLKDAIKKESLN